MSEDKKTEIAEWLRGRGDYVSGQELCGHLGVSRTAVWKLINQLKEEGYEIEAVQNRGYRLTGDDMVFGREAIASRLHTRWAGRNLKFYSEIGSTNLQAKQEAEDGAPSGTLVVADMQTAGRGRRGRGWVSPAGTNIYFTIMLKPEFSPDKASMLTIVMAHAVCLGIRQETGLTCGIKWPNDIVVDGKKAVGILTELSAERDYIQNVVIGVGINVKCQEFAPEIADRAISLEEACGHHVSRSRLVAVIMDRFEEDYEEFVAHGDLESLMDSYNEMLVNRGRNVCVLDPRGEYTGIAGGITRTGELLVEKADGSVQEVYAGEVSVRGVYGYV